MVNLFGSPHIFVDALFESAMSTMGPASPKSDASFMTALAVQRNRPAPAG